MEPLQREFIGRMPNMVNGSGSIMFGFIVSIIIVLITGFSNSNLFPLLNLACALAIWLVAWRHQENKRKEKREKRRKRSRCGRFPSQTGRH